MDLSLKQIEKAKIYLKENGYTAKFICAPMESVEDDSDKDKKARMLSISVCFKSRKL